MRENPDTRDPRNRAGKGSFCNRGVFDNFKSNQIMSLPIHPAWEDRKKEHITWVW